MSPSGAEYLRHILDECGFIWNAVGSISREAFLVDETLKRAVVRSLEVIGEATKQVPAAIRTAHPLIEWRAIAGIRDRLIHEYFGVDYEIVWDVATSKVPDLRAEVEKILHSVEGSQE